MFVNGFAGWAHALENSIKQTKLYCTLFPERGK